MEESVQTVSSGSWSSGWATLRIIKGGAVSHRIYKYEEVVASWNNNLFNHNTMGDSELCLLVVMLRSGLVQSKKHFAWTLDRTYGLVQADCWTLDWILKDRSGRSGSGNPQVRTLNPKYNLQKNSVNII